MTVSRGVVGGFPESARDWNSLVRSRRKPIRNFLVWASRREASGESLRLDSRDDLARVESVIPAFDEPWWAAVVYSCFDSVRGTMAAASSFARPMSARRAATILMRLDLPVGSVQHHRTQPGNKGARTALLAACDAATEFEAILRDGHGFDERYVALRALKAPQWGRTTCFDLLIRAGLLGVAGSTYRPDRAYLFGSTGPSKGFASVFGIEVTRENGPRCDALLQGWTERWLQIAAQARVRWQGAPYEPADFENALCVYQEPGSAGYGRMRDVVC